MRTYKGKVTLPNGVITDVTVQAKSYYEAVGMLEAQYGRGNLLGGGVNDITPLTSPSSTVFGRPPSQTQSSEVRSGVAPIPTLSSGRDGALGILFLVLLGGGYYLTTLPWGVDLIIVLGVAALIVFVRRTRRKKIGHDQNTGEDALGQNLAESATVGSPEAGSLEEVAGPLKNVASALEEVAVVLREDLAASAAEPLKEVDAALEQKDYQKAVQLLRPLADKGHVRSQYNLGLCYQKGLGIEQDYAEAGKWFRRAAEQGEPNAQFQLGVNYENGWGVLKSSTEALKWYRGAAEQGDCEA